MAEVWKIEWFGDYQSTNSRSRHHLLTRLLFSEDQGGVPRQTAMNLKNGIPNVGIPPKTEYLDLAKPLMRWRRNYIAALKMGELELNGKLNAMQKVTALLKWMRDDFILAGPAAVLAFLYFAPNSPPRKGLLKHIKADNRQIALAGIKNAAWDITYLSDFARRINERRESPENRYIFATFDKRLRDLARFVIGEHHETVTNEGLAKSFGRWWSTKDAQQIAELWESCSTRTRTPEWWNQYKSQPNYVSELISRGEAILMDWKSAD